MTRPEVLLATVPERQADWQAASTQANLAVTICDRDGLSDALLQRPAGLLIDAVIFDSLAEMQSALAQTNAAIMAVLPAQASAAERSAAGRLPGVCAVHGAETSLIEVVQQLAARLKTSASTAEPMGSSRAARAGVRLAFWGTRGGVGVSTTAAHLAQILAEDGLKVAAFDTTRRGDLYRLCELVPSDQPVQRGNLTLYRGEPDEGRAGQHQAVIIDGGRQRGAFNARWIELSKPPSDEQIRRWAQLEPVTAGRSFSLPWLFTLEVTD